MVVMNASLVSHGWVEGRGGEKLYSANNVCAEKLCRLSGGERRACKKQRVSIKLTPRINHLMTQLTFHFYLQLCNAFDYKAFSRVEVASCEGAEHTL